MQNIIFTIVLIYITLFGVIYSNCQALTAPIQIALVGPFSGTYAAYGNQLLAGASQAISDINSQGGINNSPIEIIPIDDQCDPDLAVNVADEIIRSGKYTAVIGHVCSAASLATAKLYAKANMLVITPTATNPKITETNVNTLFRVSGNDNQQGRTAAGFIANTLQSKKIAILHDDELYSRDLANLVAENLVYLSASPALYQAVPRGTRNFTNLIKKLKTLDIDAIYFAGLYPEVAALAKALNVLELQIPLISADGIAIDQFVKEMPDKESAFSVLLTFATNPNNLVSSRSLLQAMRENKFSTHGYSLYAYASVQIAIAAMQKTNKLDGKSLANWLHLNTVDTVLGTKSWDTSGDIIDHEFKVYAWQHYQDELALKSLSD